MRKILIALVLAVLPLAASAQIETELSKEAKEEIRKCKKLGDIAIVVFKRLQDGTPKEELLRLIRNNYSERQEGLENMVDVIYREYDDGNYTQDRIDKMARVLEDSVAYQCKKRM